MGLVAAFHEREAGTEQRSQRGGVVAHDRQPAAPLRAVRRESPDDDMAARTHGLPEARRIGGAIRRVGEEMQRGAIVPDVVGLRRPPRGDVGGDPLRLRAGRAEPRLRGRERVRGEVEHRDGAEPALEQGVDQPRRPAADVDDRGLGRDPGGADEIERDGRALLEPADLALALGPVDVLPVGMTIGAAHAHCRRSPNAHVRD
jgi:hypothetical protein